MAWLHALGFIHFYDCIPCPLLPAPSRYGTGKGSAWGQGSRKGGSGREEGSEVGALQGERKDTRDGARARTREPRPAGGRGLKGAGERVRPPLPCTLGLQEAKPANPNLDENQEAAQVGNLECGISPALPVLQTSLLDVYIYVLCYIIDVKDACGASVHTGAPSDPRASCSQASPAPGRPGTSAMGSLLPAIHRSIRAPDSEYRHEGTPGRRAGLPGTVARESITYQFSCIHWMASFSLNCFSNSYSCKVNTDMFIGADLRSRYVFSTQNKIICKALDFEGSPVCCPHPPPSVFPWLLGVRQSVSPSLSATSTAEHSLCGGSHLLAPGLSSSRRPQPP